MPSCTSCGGYTKYFNGKCKACYYGPNTSRIGNMIKSFFGLRNSFKIPEKSDGEAAVEAALKRMNIRYEPEYEIRKLKGDTVAFRRADFYLPDYDIFLEYFGGWEKDENEKRRYRHKRIVYEKNKIRCIYIYPKQLNYLRSAIQKGLETNGRINPILSEAKAERKENKRRGFWK